MLTYQQNKKLNWKTATDTNPWYSKKNKITEITTDFPLFDQINIFFFFLSVRESEQGVETICQLKTGNILYEKYSQLQIPEHASLRQETNL